MYTFFKSVKYDVGIFIIFIWKPSLNSLSLWTKIEYHIVQKRCSFSVLGSEYNYEINVINIYIGIVYILTIYYIYCKISPINILYRF